MILIEHEEIHKNIADRHRDGVAACLVGLVWLGSRPDEPTAASVSETSPSPSFEVRVAIPRMGRPLGGILPDWVVKKMDGTPSELRFDHKSSGAQIRSVEDGRVELRADGWEFFMEIDGEGKVAPVTHLVFPVALGGRHLRLNCRPADGAKGYLSTSTRPDSGDVVAHFLVELTTCKNVESAKISQWPPAALTVRGSFVGQPQPPSPEPKGDRPKI